MTAIATWPAQAENWLDARGKAAWIGAMILGFIVFWPIGLALLFYRIFFKGTFSGLSSTGLSSPGLKAPSFGARGRSAAYGFRSSGNMAFDAYKAETLRRLEEEQDAFNAFLKRLREARDRAEFDQFMNDRSRKAPTHEDCPEARVEDRIEA